MFTLLPVPDTVSPDTLLLADHATAATSVMAFSDPGVPTNGTPRLPDAAGVGQARNAITTNGTQFFMGEFQAHLHLRRDGPRSGEPTDHERWNRAKPGIQALEEKVLHPGYESAGIRDPGEDSI